MSDKSRPMGSRAPVFRPPPPVEKIGITEGGVVDARIINPDDPVTKQQPNGRYRLPRQ